MKKLVITSPKNAGIKTIRFKLEILYIYIPYRFNRERSTVDDIPGMIVDRDNSIPIKKYFKTDNKL